jgi:hypothetical protein
MTWKLWIPNPVFPMFGVVPVFENWPGWAHWSLHLGAMLLMGMLVVFPKKEVAAVLMGVVFLQLLGDQDRWQPWEYQYLLSFGVFVFFKTKEYQLAGWQFILACNYFFSGFFKLSPDFIFSVWQRFFLWYGLGINEPGIWLTRLGYIIPFLEITLAISLLFNKTREMAVYLLAVMHLFILAMYWPLDLGTSVLLLPWNSLMIVFLIGSYSKRPLLISQHWLRQPFAWVLVVCLGLLPWLHLWNKWDGNLSMAMYSKGGPTIYICPGNEKAKKELYPYLIKGHWQTGCDSVVFVNSWSWKNKGTAFTLEDRTMKQLKTFYEEAYLDSNARYYIYQPGFGARIQELWPSGNNSLNFNKP